jgi:hypothetical protein
VEELSSPLNCTRNHRHGGFISSIKNVYLCHRTTLRPFYSSPQGTFHFLFLFILSVFDYTGSSLPHQQEPLPPKPFLSFPFSPFCQSSALYRLLFFDVLFHPSYSSFVAYFLKLVPVFRKVTSLSFCPSLLPFNHPIIPVSSLHESIFWLR